jgi:hypothetical protein
LQRLDEPFCFSGNPSLIAVYRDLSLELVSGDQLLAVVAKLVS